MRVVTHDGIFHADDVFAAATLLIAHAGNVRIHRTRDPRRLAAADLAFDVGGGAYDHHQPGGNGQRPNGIPYASFGLVWRDYGTRAVRQALPSGHALDDDQAAEVAAEVDRLLVQPVDAADNGVALHTGEPAFDGVRGVSVSTVISWMNPGDDAHGLGVLVENDAWWSAVGVARTILDRAIAVAAATVGGRRVLRDAIAAAAGGPVVVLPRYVPDWQAALCATDAQYVVYPSAGTWRVQGVPAAYGRPEVRRPLPAAWAGLDGAELAALTGVADATFAHRGRFIAGAQSQAGAEALAALALAE